MSLLLDLAAGLYLIAALLIALSAASYGLLLLLYLLSRRRHPSPPPVTDADLLSVTVQLPVYNEADVVARLIDACATLDYPPEKLCIQILDDSSDHTTHLIEQRVAYWKSQPGPEFCHIRRAQRDGYKAGALAYGLVLTHTDCVAVFDADFVPAPDFLRRTMPYFSATPRLALVQTRWQHLNPAYNLLTRAQALSIDGHFVIEQTARNRWQLPMSMNGTGGVWRTSAITDAGGWRADTLTEDLDLSYRALMRGWEFLYLVDVAVPGELPPQVQAYKMQQARWATGSTECLIRHIRPLIASRRFSLLGKLMGVMHLAQYAVQPLILLLFLLTPPLLWGGGFAHLPDLRLLTVIGLVPLLVVALAQHELYSDWPRRLLYFPVQVMTAIAIVLSNSRAVMRALIRPGQPRRFERTPKYRVTRQGQDWTLSPYRLRPDASIIAELLLAAYALFGLALALDRLPAFAPYMLSYALSFGFFALWNLRQGWQARRDT
ncbi:glycosyltransferase [bacterium]|nr:glycosyltransferase [bacterium]